MKSRYQHAIGLVLKHYTLGEHDRRVLFLAPGIGKISAKARGAKKITSPFIGRLSPLNICELLLYRTPGNSWTITQCQAKRTFHNLQSSLRTSSLALSIIDIATKCTEEDHPSDALYNCTIETLELLNTLEDETKCELLFQAYQIKILDILGILPSFSTCSHCHKKIDLETLDGWHPLELLCPSCLATTNHLTYHLFNNNYLKLLNFIRKKPFEEILKIRLNIDEEKDLKKILQMLWSAQTFSIPKSLGVLESLHA